MRSQALMSDRDLALYRAFLTDAIDWLQGSINNLVSVQAQLQQRLDLHLFTPTDARRAKHRINLIRDHLMILRDQYSGTCALCDRAEQELDRRGYPRSEFMNLAFGASVHD